MGPEQVIKLLELEPLEIEGGYFRRTYLADESLSSCIYFVLTENTFSELHRLKSDEIYHFYMGDPVELIELHEDGSNSTVTLGSYIGTGEKCQHVVRRNTWQGSRLKPGGSWALMGCTTAPAFDFANYESGKRSELVSLYPELAEVIKQLTRK